MADGIRQDVPKPEGGKPRLARAKNAWNFLKEKIPWKKSLDKPTQEPRSEAVPTISLSPVSKPDNTAKPDQASAEAGVIPPPEAPKESTEAYNQRIYGEVFASIKKIAEMTNAKQDPATELQRLRGTVADINSNLSLPGRFEQSMQALNSVLKFSNFEAIAPAVADAIVVASTHIPLIEGQIRNYNDPNTIAALEGLNRVAGITDPRHPEHFKVVDVLNRKIGVVADGIRSGDNRTVMHYLPYLQQYILELNPLYRDEHRAYAHQATLLLREAVERHNIPSTWRIIGQMIDSPYTHISAESYKVLREELNKYDLDPSDLYPAWKLGNPEKSMGYMVSDNMRTIAEVTARLDNPKAIAELRREFNLKNFNRYPAEMLADQYLRKDIVDDNQILIATADYDHNGNLQKADVLSAFYTPAVKANSNVRFIEFGDKNSAAKVFGDYKEKYGESDDGVLIVHGYKDGIVSGGPDTHIDTDSLVSVLQGVYKKDANLVLLSCSTGLAGGVGETIHDRLGLKVTGPDQDCNTESLQIREDESGKIIKDAKGRSVIDVKYLPGTVTKTPTRTMVYE